MKYAKKIILLTTAICASSLAACAVSYADYEICDTPNCGDNVSIEIVGNFNRTDNPQ